MFVLPDEELTSQSPLHTRLTLQPLAQLRSDSINDYLSMALDPSVKAVSYVQWDGNVNTNCTLAPTGLQTAGQGIDLTDGGSNVGMVVRVINSDGLRVDITVKIYTNTGNWGSRTVALETQVSAGEVVDLFMPFTSFTNQAGTMNPASVGAIELALDGSTNSTSADVQIDLIKATASYEYGDLPIGYGNSILDARHIPLGMRLGYNVDTETAHNASDPAGGDDNDQFDDEDGVIPWQQNLWAADTDQSVVVRFTGCGNPFAGGNACYINGWIDWNRDGDFDDASEDIFEDVVQTADSITNMGFDFHIPPGTSFNNARYYARFRICPAVDTCDQPDDSQTDVTDGEIEDYAWDWGTPTAVTLASFDASSSGNAVELVWETGSEFNSLGFNLYRAEAADGAQTKLNATLIPSEAPGGALGATYQFTDESVSTGVTYYYWLEDVGADRASATYGPVSATVTPQVRLLLVRPRLEPGTATLSSR